jgi:hypothetical protein
MSKRSPISSIAGGLLAGAIGTIAMDALWYRRYRAAGGTDNFASWEFSDADSISDAGAPAQVGKQIIEAVSDVELTPEDAGTATNVVHWATGLGWGALHGLASLGIVRPRVAHGVATGMVAWLAAYGLLAPADIYKPIWEYEPQELWKDLSAHLVFGVSTATAFVAISRLVDR